jgi:hypothetical protein
MSNPEQIRERQKEFLALNPEDREQVRRIMHLAEAHGKVQTLSQHFTPEALRALDDQQSQTK